MKYLMLVVLLSGCASEARKDTGSFRCVGVCELSVDHSKVVVEKDGSKTETNSGITGDSE